MSNNDFWGTGSNNNNSVPPIDFNKILGNVPLLIIIGIVIWLSSGFFVLDSNQQAVITRFGAIDRVLEGNSLDPINNAAGINYRLPSPIEEVIKYDTTTTRELLIGCQNKDKDLARRKNDPCIDQSLMLTADQNILDVSFQIQWNIKNLEKFIFFIKDPEMTINQVSESSMRAVVASNDMEYTRNNREEIRRNMVLDLQKTLDEYNSGVEIKKVEIGVMDPPDNRQYNVLDAFRGISAAKIEKERRINEAIAQKNKILPEARGQAAIIVKEAEAYAEQIVLDAEGQSERFLSVYDKYNVRGAKEITKHRMYIDTMSQVFKNTNKIIIDDKVGGSVLPYLPLGKLNNKIPK